MSELQPHFIYFCYQAESLESTQTQAVASFPQREEIVKATTLNLDGPVWSFTAQRPNRAQLDAAEPAERLHFLSRTFLLH